MTNTEATIAVAVQQFVLGMMAACAHAGVKKSKSPQAITTVRVPGAQVAVPLLLDYARRGMFTLKVLGGECSARVTRIWPGTEGLDITLLLTTSTNAVTSSHMFTVPYLSDKMEDLCGGHWVDFGDGCEVRMNPSELLPNITATLGSAFIYPRGVEVRRHVGWLARLTLGWWSTVTLGVRVIDVNADNGFVFFHPLGRFAHVELEWGA